MEVQDASFAVVILSFAKVDVGDEMPLLTLKVLAVLSLVLGISQGTETALLTDRVGHHIRVLSQHYLPGLLVFLCHR